MRAYRRNRWWAGVVCPVVLAFSLGTRNSPGQDSPVQSAATSTNFPVSVSTNTISARQIVTNRWDASASRATNDTKRAATLPAASTLKEGNSSTVFNKSVPSSVEARMERYERMNGRKLFEFDGGTKQRRDWIKAQGVSPQYRWDVFQNGKAPPRGFRDGITSTYFD